MSRSLATATVISLIALAGLCEGSPTHQQCFNWNDVEHLVAFGDSYTFVQGTAGYPNYSFIGSYLPGQLGFTPTQLLEDKIVQNFTGTAEGGPNWVEYLTGCAVEDGYHSPADCSIQLWNFAFAGADISEALLPLHHNYTIPLVNQTQQYLTYADKVLTRAPIKLNKSKTLVAIWIGINDINDSKSYKPANSTDTEFWTLEIDTLFSQSVTPLLNSGFKNFLFVNLPPLDRTSSNQKAATPYPSKVQVDLWNSLLASHIKDFEKKSAGAKAMLYDANKFLNGVLDNPAQYGVTNTTSYCPAYNQLDVLEDPAKYGCNPLDEYFWYNSGHMTSHTHEVMVPDLKAFLKSQATH